MFLQNGGRDNRRGRVESVNNATCAEVVIGKMEVHTRGFAVMPAKCADIILINVLDIKP